MASVADVDLHLYPINGIIPIVHRDIDDLIDDVHSFQYLSKDGVSIIKVWRIFDTYEKLTTSAIFFLSSRHGQNAPLMSHIIELSRDSP